MSDSRLSATPRPGTGEDENTAGRASKFQLDVYRRLGALEEAVEALESVDFMSSVAAYLASKGKVVADAPPALDERKTFYGYVVSADQTNLPKSMYSHQASLIASYAIAFRENTPVVDRNNEGFRDLQIAASGARVYEEATLEFVEANPGAQCSAAEEFATEAVYAYGANAIGVMSRWIKGTATAGVPNPRRELGNDNPFARDTIKRLRGAGALPHEANA